MKQGLFQVVANEQLTETVWKMDLVGGNHSAISFCLVMIISISFAPDGR